MSTETNRRLFILNSLKAAGGLAAASTLGACSTFDEYLFEDAFYLKDQTIIVGGGISGMYLAYKLRQNKMAYRIFEGSSRLGGRIRSNKGYDYGASVYSDHDETLKSLIKEYAIPITNLDKNNFYLNNGMQSLIDYLFEHTAGLITYRSVRLRWKLISIQKINSLFEVVFDGPKGRRTFVAKKVALAIPPNQWGSIAGLYDLPEMAAIKTWAQSVRKENTMKVILTSQQSYSLNSTVKSLSFYEDDHFEARQVIKKNKSTSWVEIDLTPKNSQVSVEIEKINDFIKKKMNINFLDGRMSAENYFDWNKIELIQGAAFSSPIAIPDIKSSQFQVIGDFSRLDRAGTVEGALLSAIRGADYLL
ncbi:MAG: NAD(P)-binding protein [Bdellovibrio sp.]|nr:NAD(P)-binding protein [Bdellovibrio sp.]